MSWDPRLLHEVAQIGSKFQFFSVGGNLRHLVGNAHETVDVKYSIEITFDEDFPSTPPQLIFSQAITDLMGPILQLGTLANWSATSAVVGIIEEVQNQIQVALGEEISDATQTPALKTVPAKTPRTILCKFRLMGAPVTVAIKIIEVDPTKTCADVKKIVLKEYKLNPNSPFQLIYKGKMVPDNMSFAKIGVKSNDVISIMTKDV
ncbi:MAG TPA: ubiquitin-like protein [Candidatus Lokiarchaeia archaeon]|nr:ubiquitin-like protein [Candidatus Lokiarchaeia archaeon]